MRLPSFLSSLTQRAPSGRSLGVAADGNSLCAALVQRTAGAKPLLLASGHFHGASALKAMTQWQAKQGRPSDQTTLLLSGDDYQLLPIDTLDLPASELAEAARWKVKDMIDFPAEQAAVACVLVPAAQDATRARQALAVVTQRPTVARWMLRARQDRCRLSAIDIPELALRNLLALVSSSAPSPAATGLLHIGLQRSTLVMVWQGELCTCRRFDLTAAQWLSADLDRRAALLERLALDLQRTCDAFERQFHAAALGQLWVTQAHPDMQLAPLLQQHVALNLQAFDLHQHIDLPGINTLIDPDQGFDYIPALGAALRDEAPPQAAAGQSKQAPDFRPLATPSTPAAAVQELALR